MKRSVKDRVVVVTGASAGVGRATVRELARRGAHVGLIARGIDGLRGAEEEVRRAGRQALVTPCDVSDPDAVEESARKIEAELGPIDVWINNAMTSVFAPVKDMRAEEFRRVTEVTYLGYVHGTISALRLMLPRDAGTIVQVGSALAYRSIPLQSAYCAAKHAVNGFTESLRSELMHDGSRVQVCQVHLPAINTPQFSWSRSRMPFTPRPVAPIFQPEVAARAIVDCAESPRRELWLGFPTVKAILAERFVPSLADRYLALIGYDAQQTEQPSAPEREDNLWAPLPGDYGAHGQFDLDARSHSVEYWLRRNRLLIAGAAAVGLVAGFAKRRSA